MQSSSERRPWARPTIALVLSYVGFVSLGLPDTVLGAAWPAIRADLAVPLEAAGSAVTVTTVGIVVASASSGWLRARVGTAAVLVASTILAALALAIGARAPSWNVLLAGAFVAGLGGGAVDASLNYLVARRHSARHMNWLHACWGVGASLTPMLVAAMLNRGLSWRRPYAILAGVELALALAFLANHRAWRDDDPAARPTATGERPVPARGAMAASVLLFACYGGVEAGTGLWATSLLTMTRNASPALAGAMLAAYWGALTTGRFVLGACAERFGALRLLRLAVWSALAALAVLAIPGTPLWFCGVALAALGFALAPIYPLVMHDTASRFEKAGARLVGYQVAACSVGIAIIPGLLGVLGARTSVLAIPPALLVFATGVVLLERRRRSSG